jgi:hypothetical protein
MVDRLKEKAAEDFKLFPYRSSVLVEFDTIEYQQKLFDYEMLETPVLQDMF